jgi:hypothetical protein
VSWHDGLIHSGIKTAAEWFMNNIFDTVVELLGKQEYSKLILVGHSLGRSKSLYLLVLTILGGATAAVLTMMMVNRFKDLNVMEKPIDIHCYSYAPPPVVSLDLAKAYKYYIDSFVVEDDAVCRLSYGHMMDLKTMLICAIESTKDKAFTSVNSIFDVSLRICVAIEMWNLSTT